MIRITHFQRKPHVDGNFSVEFIFDDVRRRLAGDLDVAVSVSVASWESTGILNRIKICLEAIGRQGDVNHVTGDINYAGILLRKSRTIQSILDLNHLERTTGLRRAILKLLWVTLPIRRCTFVTAISEATKAEILRHAPWCDPAKVVVIPIAISENYRPSDKPFSKESPRILQVGTANNKNVPRLVAALKGVPCTLDIVGTDRPDYRRLLAEAGIKHTYRSRLTEPEMVRSYHEADIVAFVSTYEGFGMPIVEAQSVGRPVITSNVSSMPEVAGAGACLVDPFDVDAIRKGVQRVIHDDVYREELRERGFANARRFEPDRIARRYLSLYQDTMAYRRRRVLVTTGNGAEPPVTG